jgi:uncharacterized protein VirK/YbjX
VRRLKIKIDLESLWRDLGAEPEDNGFFMLSPQVLIPQDFNDVPSHKRAEAKRKSALTRQFLEKLSTSVNGFRYVAPL